MKINKFKGQSLLSLPKIGKKPLGYAGKHLQDDSLSKDVKSVAASLLVTKRRLDRLRSILAEPIQSTLKRITFIGSSKQSTLKRITFNRLKARRKKSRADLADIEVILELLS
jgi:hypothetical protein